MCFFLISCVEKKEAPDVQKKVPSIDILSSEYKDIDTTIQLAPFNLKPFSAKTSVTEKKVIVEKAIKSAIGENAEVFLERPCFKIDSLSQRPAKIGRGLECRLSDFHLIDLDKDGDLDIIYSSVIDQNINTDTNSLLIFRNNGNNFKEYSLKGYLYSADFSQSNNGKLKFRNALGPCCDYHNYNFYETELDLAKWSFKTEHKLEIHKSKVTEKLL